MATGEDGRGARPPAGVTFLGVPAVKPTDDAYQLRHPDGQIEGPHASAAILERIATGELNGTEGVSRDGAFWIPIMAIPAFRNAFDQEPAPSSTMFGGAFRPAGEDVDRHSAVTAANPTRPAPLAESGLGISMSGGRESFRSGAWSNTADAGLGRTPGASTLTPASAGSTQRLDLAGLSELPLPRGFTDTPGLTEESGALPILTEPDRSTGIGGPEAGLPVSRGAGRSLLDEMDEDGEQGMASALNGGLDDLPRSSAGLPQTAFGGALPRSAAGLPQSAAQAPRSAAGLPQSSVGLPGAVTGLEVSTATAMSGEFDLNNFDLPASQASRPAGTTMLSALGGGGPELPASSTHQAPSLQDLGKAALWNDDDIIPGVQPSPDTRAASAAPRSAAASAFDFEDDPFVEDGWKASPGAPGATSLSKEGGNSSFFSDDDLPPTPALPEPVPAAAKASKARPQRSGKMGRLLLMGGVVVGVGAAAVLVVPRLLGLGGEPDEGSAPIVMAVADTGPAVPMAAVIGDLSTIRGAGPVQLREYVSAASISTNSAPDDRAKVLVAQALILAFVPSESSLASSMRELYISLEGVTDGDADLLALGRGAFEAVSNTGDAATTLSGIRNPSYAPLARTFEAIHGIQQYRGLRYDAQAAPPPATEGSAAGIEFEAPVDGSGTVAEGSAPAEGSAVAAETSATPPAAEGSAVAVAPAEGSGVVEGSGDAVVPPVAAPVVVAVELSDDVARKLDAAIAADPELTAAIYWRGWTHLEDGEYEDALSRFERAVGLNPLHVPAEIGASRALLRAGRFADADARVQRIIDEMEAQSSPGERADTYMASAEISIARLQTQLAIESLLSALQADPRNRRALTMLGEQFYESGQYQRAIEYFQSNADLAQDDPEAILAVVRAHIGLGQLDEARAALESAQSRFPLDGRFPYFLGRVAEENAEFDRAIEYYTQATQIDGSFMRSWLRLAQLAQRANNVPDALQHISRIPLDDLDSAPLANEVGEVYLLLGELNRAVGAFRRALAIDQTYPNARMNLASHYLDIGQQQRAFAEVEQMVTSGVDTPRVKFLHARTLTALGQYSQAMEELTQLVNIDEQNPDYLFELGLAHFGAGDWVNARRRFSEAYGTNPLMADALYYVGRCDIELAAFNEAISELTTVSMRSNRGEFHYWLGVALEAGAQTSQAYAEYTKAINDDVAWSLENPEVYFRRATIFAERNAPSAARRDLQVLLTLRPRHAPGLRTMAQLSFDERDFERAITLYTRSLAEEPDQPLVRYFIGRAYLEKDPSDLPTALGFLEAARAGGVAERTPDLHRRLGYLYRDLGRTQDAIASLRAYLEVPTLSPEERRTTENIINELNGIR